MELQGSKTEKNLRDAFAGESQANTKYGIFAEVARKEGYQQIGQIFDETAGNEEEHAEVWLKHLNGIGNTLQNLKECIKGETYESTVMYPGYAKQAREEGFEDIAALFEEAGEIEASHAQRYSKLAENIETGKVFEKDYPIAWQCRNCGYIHIGTAAPQVCPFCGFSQAYFQIYARNY